MTETGPGTEGRVKRSEMEGRLCVYGGGAHVPPTTRISPGVWSY